jgi:hypothetical protein
MDIERQCSNRAYSCSRPCSAPGGLGRAISVNFDNGAGKSSAFPAVQEALRYAIPVGTETPISQSLRNRR